MKTHSSRMFLLPAISILASAAIVLPSKGSAPEVALVGMALVNRDGQHNPAPVFHVFGGQTVGMDLKLEAAAETSPIMLEARFFSKTDGLGAPLGPALGLEELRFDGQRFRSLRVALPIPKVANRTEIDVQFRTRNGAVTRSVGNARCFVYPENLGAPLRGWQSKLREEAGLTLGVFGKSGVLRAFLTENKVIFEDLGEKVPFPSVRTMLLVGDAPPAELEDWQRRLPPDAEVRLVVFTEDPWRLPGVYSDTIDRFRVTKITLPILSQLATNPLHQVSLVEILTRSIPVTPRTTANDL